MSALDGTLPPAPIALDLIKRFEGCKLKAYQDQGGVWTVGYGCTGHDIAAGTVWTQEQADAEADKRVRYFQHCVDAMLEVTVNPNQLAAMVSLAYNIGLDRFEKSRVRERFNKGDHAGAADAFRSWRLVNGVVNNGLVNRREAERAIFMK